MRQVLMQYSFIPFAYPCTRGAYISINSFCVILHIAPNMLSFFPHYALFNAHRCHHCVYLWIIRDVIESSPCSHMFSSVLKLWNTVLSLSTWRESRREDDLEYDTKMPVWAGTRSYALGSGLHLTSRKLTRTGFDLAPSGCPRSEGSLVFTGLQDSGTVASHLGPKHP